MKKIVTNLIVIISVFSNCIAAHNDSSSDCNLIIDENVKNEIEKITAGYNFRISDLVAKEKIASLQGIESENWTINYWLAIYYSNTRNFIEAQRNFDKALQLFKENTIDCYSSSFYGLQAHIYKLQSDEKEKNGDLEKRDYYSKLSETELQKGLSINPDNPLLLIMIAVETLQKNKGSFQSQIIALNLLNKAKGNIDENKGVHILNINNWNYNTYSTYINSLKNNLYPEKNNKAISEYKKMDVPITIKNHEWIVVLKDSQNDGRRKGSADGKSLAYYYNDAEKTLWFRLETFNKLNDSEYSAVSISFDTDFDQKNGINWYGSNRAFKVDKMISIGPLFEKIDSYVGYNGITNADGIKNRDWLNVNRNIVKFYIDSVEGKHIYLGIQIDELGINEGDKIRFLGSVGSNAIWNDDIGDNEYATIKLD